MGREPRGDERVRGGGEGGEEGAFEEGGLDGGCVEGELLRRR